jgi:hypothetical protein
MEKREHDDEGGRESLGKVGVKVSPDPRYTRSKQFNGGGIFSTICYGGDIWLY